MKKNILFNRIVGFSIILLGTISLMRSIIKEELSLIIICVIIINLLVGTLIIYRNSFLLHKRDSLKSYWIPALLLNLLNFNLSLPLSNWTTIPIGLFLVGTSITLLSLLFLGKNFGVRPAVRDIVITGPYKIIRHPTYLGQCIMATSCFIANSTVLSALTFLALLFFQLLRIIEEENLLKNHPVYLSYSKSIKWRLIPYIW